MSWTYNKNTPLLANAEGVRIVTESGTPGTVIEGPCRAPTGETRVLVDLDGGDISSELTIEEFCNSEMSEEDFAELQKLLAGNPWLR